MSALESGKPVQGPEREEVIQECSPNPEKRALPLWILLNRLILEYFVLVTSHMYAQIQVQISRLQTHHTQAKQSIFRYHLLLGGEALNIPSSDYRR